MEGSADAPQQQQASEPRERILRTAHEWFSRNGFQAVGVDMLVEKSGVAKMTLYRHFSSKDELILEVLAREDARIQTWKRRTLQDIAPPKATVRAFFEALERRTNRDTCAGCLFQRAAAEFPDPQHDAHRFAAQHKKGLRADLENWVRSAGITNAETVAHQLYLLMEGAWTGARLRVDELPTRGLSSAALLLVEAALFAQAVGMSPPRDA